MPDTKNTNKIDNPAAGEKIVGGNISPQEMPDQKTTETARASSEIEKDKDFVDEEVKNIGADTKAAGEKASEFSDMVIDKLKKGLSQVYEVGAKVVDDLSQAAQEYAEKHKTESEIRKLKGERDLLLTQLGHSVFKRHREKGKVSESFLKEEGIIVQFDQIETLDKKIINAGKRLDNVKK